MNMMTTIETAQRADAATQTRVFPNEAPRVPFVFDPLGDDRPDDDVVVTTRRGIGRIALVAAETAGRFQREGVQHDPLTWMFAPRALFGGHAAVDACLDRDACMRGILLHGLSLGMDADPALLDALIDDEDDDDVEDVDLRGYEFGTVSEGDTDQQRGDREDAGKNGLDDDDSDEDIDFSGVEFERDGGIGLPQHDRCFAAAPPRAGNDDGPRLFTAVVTAHDGFEIVQAFHASLADDEAEIAGRLYMRMGATMADAVIVDGFDPSMPLVTALVSTAMCDMLTLIASDPCSPLAAGIDLNVEQRFLA